MNAAQTAVSEKFPDLWQYAIGLLFVGTVLLFPGGLAGGIRALLLSIGRGSQPAVPVLGEPEAVGPPELARA